MPTIQVVEPANIDKDSNKVDRARILSGSSDTMVLPGINSCLGVTVVLSNGTVYAQHLGMADPKNFGNFYNLVPNARECADAIQALIESEQKRTGQKPTISKLLLIGADLWFADFNLPEEATAGALGLPADFKLSTLNGTPTDIIKERLGFNSSKGNKDVFEHAETNGSETLDVRLSTNGFSIESRKTKKVTVYNHQLKRVKSFNGKTAPTMFNKKPKPQTPAQPKPASTVQQPTVVIPVKA